MQLRDEAALTNGTAAWKVQNGLGCSDHCKSAEKQKARIDGVLISSRPPVSRVPSYWALC